MTVGAATRVERALRLAHSTQGSLNAFTHIDDSSLGRARRLDAEVASGAEPGPLFGVPVGLKDLIDQEGVATTAGSAFYREVARRSAVVVERLEAAGAVIIGRTGLHEWAFGFSSENPHFGPVRNPWDLETSVGGSSGGTAAAVAAGITPLGVGTDTGGSVRVPAALCGRRVAASALNDLEDYPAPGPKGLLEAVAGDKPKGELEGYVRRSLLEGHRTAEALRAARRRRRADVV